MVTERMPRIQCSRPREVNRSIDVRSGTITFLPQPSSSSTRVGGVQLEWQQGCFDYEMELEPNAKFDTFVSIH